MAFRSFLAVPSCDQRLRVILPNADRVDVRLDLGALPEISTGPMTWEDVQIVYSEDLTLAAVTIHSVPPDQEPPRWIIAELFENSPAQVLARRDRSVVIDITGHERVVHAIVESTGGAKEILSFALEPNE